MRDNPIINITIPVYNRLELTEQTIRAARRNTGLPHRITVVDNGSEPDTRQMLRDLKKDGLIDHLLRLEANYGVACAANIGWRLVDAPIYMKLDNDVVITNPDWLSVLLVIMKKLRRTSVIGADLNNQMENPDFVTERKGMLGRTRRHVSGGAILIPAEVADITGHWSEDYGLYGCEDGDYGVRLKELDIPQYYFDHTRFMEHKGHDEAEYLTHYKLDKRQTQVTNRSYFMTNNFLYSHKYRAPSVPPKYIIKDFNGYRVELEENAKREPLWEAFLVVHEALEHHKDDLERVSSAINQFISVQNAVWPEAMAEADAAYARFKLS